MLNRLNKFRFPLREKVGFVFCNTTFQIEANAVITSCHFKEKWTESFAWIYESEVTNSDPLVPNTIWGYNGSGFLVRDIL